MFTEALFTIARTWKQPECPATEEWIKKTGYMYAMEYRVCACSVVCRSSRPHGLKPARLLCPWDFPGKNTRVGCHYLFQRIFPTQESNLHWQVGSLPLSRQESPVKNIMLIKMSLLTEKGKRYCVLLSFKK